MCKFCCTCLFAKLLLFKYVHTYIHMCIEFFGPHSLPDPVPLEKDNPTRTDVPTPVLDNYITVSYMYITVCKKKYVKLLNMYL